MDKRSKGCLWIGLGIAIVVAMVAVALITGAGFWAYRAFAPTAELVDPQRADERFETLRARFKDQEPLIVPDPDGRGARLRAEGRATFTGQLESLHVAAFDQGAGKLVRFTVPFWLLRLGRDGTISLGHDTLEGVGDVEKLTVKDLEALGPGLLIDERKPDGDRVLVWTE